jgi:hypothetical protein
LPIFFHVCSSKETVSFEMLKLPNNENQTTTRRCKQSVTTSLIYVYVNTQSASVRL